MSHFRPKRLIRRVVDHLSLTFGVIRGTIWGTPVPALRAVLPHPTATAWQEAPRSRDLIQRHRFRSWQSRFRQAGIRLGEQRHLPLLGVLIVFSLAVSGGSLARDPAVTAASLGRADAVRAAVQPEQRLAFYDPTDTPAGAASTAFAGGELPLPVRSIALEPKPLPWAIPESVFFLYKAGETGPPGPGRTPIATAFVLNVPDREHRGFVRFLVTARHVVDPQWAHCTETNPSSIDLRLNRRSGGVGYAKISLQDGRRPRFVTPADPTADLAAVPLDRTLIPNLDDYKILDVPFGLLPTNAETLQFHADQPVMTARVPPWPPGKSGSFPVFDAGLLAKMPSGAIDVQCGAAQSPQPASKSLHVWFINASVPQGTSGAPVYAAVARSAEGAKTPVLLGIQSVAWPDRGLAGITPSVVLRDMIESALAESGADMDFYKGPTRRP